MVEADAEVGKRVSDFQAYHACAQMHTSVFIPFNFNSWSVQIFFSFLGKLCGFAIVAAHWQVTLDTVYLVKLSLRQLAGFVFQNQSTSHPSKTAQITRCHCLNTLACGHITYYQFPLHTVSSTAVVLLVLSAGQKENTCDYIIIMIICYHCGILVLYATVCNLLRKLQISEDVPSLFGLVHRYCAGTKLVLASGTTCKGNQKEFSDS